MITDEGLLFERPHRLGIGGVQRIYRFGDWGLSLVNGARLRSAPFAWEAAVCRGMKETGDFDELDYSTPLTGDVVVFETDDEANEFIAKAKAYFESLATADVPPGE